MSTALVGSSVSSGHARGSGRGLATAGLAAGITAAVLTALAAVLTFTLWLEATLFNGPLALVAFVGAPAALVGAVCGALGLRSDARGRALAGLVLSALVVIAWVMIIAMAPWPEM